LIVTPPRLPARAPHRDACHRTCRRSTSLSQGASRRFVGGNFHATAQRGSRPTEPSRRCSLEVVHLHDDAVDLEVELAAAPLATPRTGAITSSSLPSTLMPRLTGNLCSRSTAAPRRECGKTALRPRRPGSTRSTAGRFAASAGSSCRIVPAAELRGFMNVDSPASALRSLSAVKSLQ